MPHLKSSRLVLRPFKMTDSPPLARLTNDPLILRNLLRTTYPFEPDDARRLIRRIAERRLPVWAVDDGRLVGLIGLSGEFGLWLDSPCLGKGLRRRSRTPRHRLCLSAHGHQDPACQSPI
ncbi:GNAT family N-acetyltransferase [Hyphomicrobiales bacterium]|uniref:GNAT family N-acetyltransferase n=1 Tax=Agrobacterium tumefaciens TaxID=358 RepID=UPI000DDACC5D